MNRGRVKIKRKKFGDFTVYSTSQESSGGGRSMRMTIIDESSASKAKVKRVRAKIQGNNKTIKGVKGLRSDSKRGRNSNQLRAEQQQQRSRRIGDSSRKDKTDPPKLFTKDFDARKRIEAKRQNIRYGDANKVKANSKMILQQARQEEKNASLSKSRAFSMVGDQIKIVSRVETEKEREATFTGTSLRVTTLQTSPERLKHREASKTGDSFLITTENKTDDNIETEEEKSEYSIFEARRKAKQQEAKSHIEKELPKLSSLNPISRPRKPPPVYEYEDAVSFGNSSKLLVSNLHPNVSQDDIYELFSAIAPIKSARMIRQGVAEVFYNKHQDAMNAYKKYHSRNLDGQPMICKLAAAEQAIYAPPSSRPSRRGAATSSSPVVFTVKI